MTPVTLQLKGPYHLCGREDLAFSDKAPDKPGVYIWAVERLGELWLSYVGISDNMRARQKEHVQNYLAGNYRVYGSDYLENLKPELAYDPKTQDWIKFWANSESYQRLVREQLSATRVYFASCEKDLERIESGLISTIWDNAGDDGAGEHFLDNSRRSKVVAKREKWYRLALSDEEGKQFHGLLPGNEFTV